MGWVEKNFLDLFDIRPFSYLLSHGIGIAHLCTVLIGSFDFYSKMRVCFRAIYDIITQAQSSIGSALLSASDP